MRFFCAGRHAKVPSERSHRQYTAEVGWFVGFAEGLAMFGPTENVLSTEPQIPQCTAGATAGRTLT